MHQDRPGLSWVRAGEAQLRAGAIWRRVAVAVVGGRARSVRSISISIRPPTVQQRWSGRSGARIPRRQDIVIDEIEMLRRRSADRRAVMSCASMRILLPGSPSRGLVQSNRVTTEKDSTAPVQAAGAISVVPRAAPVRASRRGCARGRRRRTVTTATQPLPRVTARALSPAGRRTRRAVRRRGRGAVRRMTSRPTIVMTPAISVAVSAVTSRRSRRRRGGSGKSSSRTGLAGHARASPRDPRHAGPGPGERLDKALAAAVPDRDGFTMLERRPEGDVVKNRMRCQAQQPAA